MSQLGMILQESLRTEQEAITILGLLTDQMDDVDRGQRRRRTLKERLRLSGMGCCGASWVFRPIVRAQEQQQQQLQQETNISGSSGMNLAAALAAERQLREWQEGEGEAKKVGTPLMRLLEESEKGVGNDWVCCVCMGRKKGAAFIPCGHTFCRVCSRELWLNRGTCPLCNRSILDTLHIF